MVTLEVDLRAINQEFENRKRYSRIMYVTVGAMFVSVSAFLALRDLRSLLQIGSSSSSDFLDLMVWSCTILSLVVIIPELWALRAGADRVQVSDTGLLLEFPDGAASQTRWGDRRADLTIYEHPRLPTKRDVLVYRGIRTYVPPEVTAAILEQAKLHALPLSVSVGFNWLPALRPRVTRIRGASDRSSSGL